jgi:DNA mismatch endonuclease (patch repair protein)
MSRIKSRNTSLEAEVFRFLAREGVYFQKHYKRAPGCPDVALPVKKKALFIDGDFWHGWRFSARRLKLQKIYWREKIAKNIARDAANRSRLKRQGWKVMRVWEHQLKRDKQQSFKKIKAFLIR